MGQALQTQFGFENRAFGQGVTLSEVMAVIQGVTGVVAVDVDRLHRVDRPVGLFPRLPAAAPRPGTAGTVAAAELLTLDVGSLSDVGVLS